MEVEKTSGKKVYIYPGLGEDPRFSETVHLIPVFGAYPQLFQSKLNETLLEKSGYLKKFEYPITQIPFYNIYYYILAITKIL